MATEPAAAAWTARNHGETDSSVNTDCAKYRYAGKTAARARKPAPCQVRLSLPESGSRLRPIICCTQMYALSCRKSSPAFRVQSSHHYLLSSAGSCFPLRMAGLQPVGVQKGEKFRYYPPATAHGDIILIVAQTWITCARWSPQDERSPRARSQILQAGGAASLLIILQPGAAVHLGACKVEDSLVRLYWPG
jgi:hypothetical protein